MKDVKRFEGRYKITRDGKVWSEYRKQFMSIHVNNGTGYYAVNMTVNGVVKRESIHRMIAEAYIPNPGNKPCVNHKDGNKLNNNIENLEWVTHSENVKHSYATGLQLGKSPKKGDHVLSKALSFFDSKTSKLLYEFDSLLSASEYFGVTRSIFARVARGERGSWRGMFILYKNY